MYVAQPEVKPGCVLRRSNVKVLESRQLVTNDEVRTLELRAQLLTQHTISAVQCALHLQHNLQSRLFWCM